MKNHIRRYLISFAAGAVVVSLLAGVHALAQFSGPSNPPPTCDPAVDEGCNPPLNIGDDPQSKGGSLSVNGSNLYANGFLVPFGNVGIGATTPNARLEVLGGRVFLGTGTQTADNEFDVCLFGNSDCSAAQSGNFSSRLNLFGGGGQSRKLTLNQDYAGDAFISSTVSNLALRTFGSGADITLLPDATGNIGIGTTNPQARLHVFAADEVWFEGDSPELVFRPTGVMGSAAGWKIHNNGSGNPDAFRVRRFDSTAADADTAEATRFIMQDDGNAGIGSKNWAGSPPAYALEVAGTAGKPGGGSFSDSSDARLKKNITPIDGKTALEKLTQLEGVSFEWIHPEDHTEGVRASVIAQELENVFPDWIQEVAPSGKDADLIPEGDTVKSISFPHDFNAYLIEALKELKKENDGLKARTSELEKRIEALEAKQ